ADQFLVSRRTLDFQAEAVLCLVYFTDLNIAAQRRSKTCRQSADECPVSCPERKQSRSRPRSSDSILARGLPQNQGSANHAACGFLCFVEFRKCCAQAQLFRVTCIDSGYQWPNQPIQQFRRKFASHECRDGLVHRGRRRFAEYVSE